MTPEVTPDVLMARLEGLSTLVSDGFKNIQRQLDAVGDLPVKVEGLERDYRSFRDYYAARHQALVDRVENLEEKDRHADERGQEWRKSSLPMIILTIVMAVTAIGGLVAAFLH